MAHLPGAAARVRHDAEPHPAHVPFERRDAGAHGRALERAFRRRADRSSGLCPVRTFACAGRGTGSLYSGTPGHEGRSHGGAEVRMNYEL